MDLSINALENVVEKVKDIKIDWRHLASIELIEKHKHIQQLIDNLSEEVDDFMLEIHEVEHNIEFLGQPTMNDELVSYILAKKKEENKLYKSLMPYYLLHYINNIK